MKPEKETRSLVELFCRRPLVQEARELFNRTWHLSADHRVKPGPNGVAWVIYAGRPASVVAGGLESSIPAAHAAIQALYEACTIAGPTGFPVCDRAGW